MRHLLCSRTSSGPDDLSTALEHKARDLLKPAVFEVFHDRDDRLFALANRDEVELIDESLRLTRWIGATDNR